MKNGRDKKDNVHCNIWTIASFNQRKVDMALEPIVCWKIPFF